MVASAILTLLAAVESELRNKAAAPFVSKVKVNFDVLGARKKPTSQTVSSDEELETYEASSVHEIVPVGAGGLALDNVA